MNATVNAPISAAFVWLIRLYRLALSPILGPSCRFEPTCSRYAEEAVLRHGWLRGGRLTLFRICRCHPFAAAGLDPVPDVVKDGTRSQANVPS